MWAAGGRRAALLATLPGIRCCRAMAGCRLPAWLGLKMLTAKPGAKPVLTSSRAIFWQAGLITLLNPQGAICFVAFFPCLSIRRATRACSPLVMAATIVQR